VFTTPTVTPPASRVSRSSSPATITKRYVDMRGVEPNETRLSCEPTGSSCATGMLETARKLFGTTMVGSMLALNDGSSQHGNTRRASVGSNWVAIIRLEPLAVGYSAK